MIGVWKDGNATAKRKVSSLLHLNSKATQNTERHQVNKRASMDVYGDIYVSEQVALAAAETLFSKLVKQGKIRIMQTFMLYLYPSNHRYLYSFSD